MTKTFGSYLQKERERAGFKSQRSFATSSGLSNATIARIENGKQVPLPSTLTRIAHCLGISNEMILKEAGYLDVNEVLDTA